MFSTKVWFVSANVKHMMLNRALQATPRSLPALWVKSLMLVPVIDWSRNPEQNLLATEIQTR
jgi:hypothetical protein